MAIIEPTHVVEPLVCSVSSLLKDGFYSIPAYQRDYRWREGNWEHLWNDTEALIGENFSSQALKPLDLRKPHFLGSFVTIRERRDQPDVAAELADGQQRLTTLSAMIAVLYYRNENSELSSPTKRQLRDLMGPCLYEQSGDGMRFRLKLAKENVLFEGTIKELIDSTSPYGFWANQIDISTRPVGLRLIDMFKYFLDQSDDMAPTELDHMIRVICDCLICLRSTVFQKATAYRLFETMNFRGLKLTQADLIKNKVLEFADSQGTHDDAVAVWGGIQEEIARQNEEKSGSEEARELTEFIQFCYMGLYGDVKREDLYEEISKVLDNVGAIDFCKALSERARLLTILVTKQEAWSENGGMFVDEVLKELGIKYAIPMFIAAGVRYRNNSNDYEQACRLIRNFCFRFFTIQGNSVSSLSKASGEIARLFRKGDLGEIISKMKEYSADTAFVEAFREKSVKTNKLAFNILKTIENKLLNNSGVGIFNQSPTQHVEHILPKTLQENGWSHIDKELHSSYVFRIGNLTVLESAINSSIRNMDFQFKNGNSNESDYQHSSMYLPKRIQNFLTEGQWDFESIERRQNWLADNAADAWSLDL